MEAAYDIPKEFINSFCNDILPHKAATGILYFLLEGILIVFLLKQRRKIQFLLMNF